MAMIAHACPTMQATIIATGGFFYNDAMVHEHAPKYAGFMPLGNIADDGSGIRLGQAAGGAL